MTLFNKLKSEIPQKDLTNITNRLGGVLGIQKPQKREAVVILLADYYDLLNKYHKTEKSNTKTNPSEIFNKRVKLP